MKNLLLNLGLATALLLAAGHSHAQAPYPSKPVRVIVPFSAGGPVDIVGRPIMEKLQSTLGQPFVLDFRGGAASMVGTDAVARAEPDGYTLLFTAAQHTINPGIHPKLPYDTLRDFVAVSQVASGSLLLVVHPRVKASNVAELITLAKSSDRKLNYASAGVGSAFHLAAEKMKTMAGIDMVHIPYKGGAPAAADLVAGHVDLMFGSSVIMPHVQADRLRLLAVTTGKRSPLLPEVPTIAESGLPGYDVGTWYGVFAPANTPREIVDLLAREIQKAVRDPKFVQQMHNLMLTPEGNTPEEFDEIVRREVPEWTKAAKQANIESSEVR
jgi:tripartite-type tricarboxylate transporter receptor subunit TctC